MRSSRSASFYFLGEEKMDFEATVFMRAYLRLQESDPQKYREERPSFEEIEEKKSKIKEN